MPKIVVGMMGSSVASGSSSLSTSSQVQQFLSVLSQYKIRELDTARVYADGRSEELLGSLSPPPSAQGFAISTKAPGFRPGVLSESNIIQNCNLSLKALNTDSVDIYYIHGPDRQTPLEEQCRAFNTLYRQQKFKRFGVSNLTDTEVQSIHDICHTNKWVMPTVYQGGFSPLHRGSSKTLRPLLQNLGMSYYAFSPFAGGLLAKPIEQIITPAKGSRYEAMPVFKDLFVNDTIISALRNFTELCAKHADITVMEATMRWFMHHAGFDENDAVIVGASTARQIEASLDATTKGPLPKEIVTGFEDLWKEIEHAAPGYHA